MLIAMDFDGVLADIYHVNRVFYEWFLESLKLPNSLLDVLLYYEDLFDAARIPHYIWWKNILKRLNVVVDDEFIDEALAKFWEIRLCNQKVFEGVEDVLKTLKDNGHKLAIVAEADEIIGLKKLRVQLSGLINYFDEVIIIGEEKFMYRGEAIKYLMDKYGYSPRSTIYVDDKPEMHMDVKARTNAITVQILVREYTGRIPWLHPYKADYVIKNLRELVDLIEYLKRS